MIFQVTKTDSYGDFKEKPHEKCFGMTLPYVDERNFRSPEAFDEYFKSYPGQGKWFDKGKNHRILENGNIARDLKEIEVWGIELNTLEDLMEFQKDVGEEVILGPSFEDKKTPCLEIYNAYRE